MDEKILVFLNSLGSERWDAFWLTVTDQFFWWWLYLILGAVILYYYGWKKGLMVLTLLVILITLNDQLVNFIKHTTARPRPCNREHLQAVLRILKCTPQYSFFSGHAANSFLFASAYWQLLKDKLPRSILLALFVWAGLLAYSRIYVGVHYPGDILAGMLEGIIVGTLTGKFIRKKIPPLSRKKPKNFKE